MVANTVFNESQMHPTWLLRQQPGMSCQPHTDILEKLLRYNVVSVIVSVILATPFFYAKVDSVKTYVARPFKRLWRSVAGAKKSVPSQEAPYQDDISTGISLTSFLLATIGVMIISLAAPCLTAISQWTMHRGNVNLWVIIQQWATRPRAACFVFPIHALIIWAKDFKGVPNGFLISALSTMIAEIPLSLFSIGFLSSQIRRHKPQFPPDFGSFDVSFPVEMYLYTNVYDEMQENASLLRYIIYWQIGLTVFFIAGCVLLALCIRGTSEPEQNHEEDDSKIFLIPLVGLWLFSVAIYRLSYLLWRDFLTVTHDDYYCVEESVYVDVIYYLLPVFLGLWRASSTLASKFRSKRKSANSIVMTECTNSQEPKDIEQAQSMLL